MKIRKSITALFLAALILTGCGGELSDKFDESEVRAAAEEIVELGNEGDFETLGEEKLGAALAGMTDEIEKGAEQVISPVGDFEKIQAVKSTGSKDKDTGTEYAVAVVLAEHDEGKVQYTISFDTTMKCVGLYMK